ncbi:hypothetical protein MIND_00804200 [Mycena indigotica]|uniref:Uncharacterized protein n=1 Tax=Mycena indigotica TaxID=2126181 RepID=A0A8H6SGV9_9AGAR|nr:uncharacterized protein MIND_00804200 [Mycena indigotica]KAF7298575.1 hypothetical protein MIND_00804200 [Mycena indigotica]
MLVGLLAPELIAGFALRQRIIAHHFSRKLFISKTHAFFICMGGFVDRNGHPLVTLRQIVGSYGFYDLEDMPLRDFPPATLAAIQTIPRAVIADKSKGDVFTKAVAFSQGLWFVVQSLARLGQRLPLTQLEVATLAFSAVNIFTWILWWDKPLDVKEPIVISVGPQPDFDGVDELGRPPVAVPLTLRFYRLVGLPYPKTSYSPTKAFSVPTFWYASWGDSMIDLEAISLMGQLFIACLFGAIHCGAWNAAFLTYFEREMWRIAAVILTGAPVLAIGVFLMDSMRGVDLEKATTLVFMPFIAVIYVLTRLILLGLPFAALRTLSPKDYFAIDWSIYIPHL